MNGEPAHGQWDLKSSIHMSQYASRISIISERSHLDSIEFKAHHQKQLWQVQSNLVRTCECQRSHDKGWLPPIIRHHVFILKT